MSNNIYPIQLLNDLHNHFPDVLYNPGRFRNIQDLLDYIRRVADVNPYTRGLNMYNSHQRSAVRRQVEPVAPVTPPLPPPVASGVTTTQINLPQSGLNNILSSVFGDLLEIPLQGGGVLQSFLNQSVVVHPTQEQINSASTRYTNTEDLEDVCTICQDTIEENQEVRRLSHCNHLFHINCIDTWFGSNVRCPTCRHDIRENVTNNNPPPVPENHRRTNPRNPE
jgi:hypothetical protein